MNLHTQCFDFAAQHPAATGIQLHAHQSRGEFNHMGFKTEILNRVGSLKTQQATTHNHTDFCALCLCLNIAKIIDGAIDHTGILLIARHWWHKGIGPSRQNQFIVREIAASFGDHRFAVAINLCNRVTKVSINANFHIMLSGSKSQIFGGSAGKIF